MKSEKAKVENSGQDYEYKGESHQDADYPSTRYFQVHFEYLQAAIDTLREQLTEASRQIAQQNEMLRSVLSRPEQAQPGYERDASTRKDNPQNAFTVRSSRRRDSSKSLTDL